MIRISRTLPPSIAVGGGGDLQTRSGGGGTGLDNTCNNYEIARSARPLDAGAVVSYVQAVKEQDRMENGGPL